MKGVKLHDYVMGCPMNTLDVLPHQLMIHTSAKLTPKFWTGNSRYRNDADSFLGCCLLLSELNLLHSSPDTSEECYLSQKPRNVEEFWVFQYNKTPTHLILKTSELLAWYSNTVYPRHPFDLALYDLSRLNWKNSFKKEDLRLFLRLGRVCTTQKLKGVTERAYKY